MKRIAIVDDSAVMRKNLRLILSKEGYEVVAEASNGEEAYRAYASSRPDLMTMDITMPVMNGIDAVKAIVKDFPEARIVVISAFDQRNMLFEAMENGAKHYMIKPITAEKLLNVVRQTLLLSPEERETAGDTWEEPGIHETAAGSSVTEPFRVENQNGVFIMSLPGPDFSQHLPNVKQALQGLLFIKPLTVQFSLTGSDSITADELTELAGLARQVLNSGGHISIHTDRKPLAGALRQAMPDLAVHHAG